MRTILSQNTTDVTSARAYDALKRRFPAWADVARAPRGAVEDAIRVGGLADIKTARIKVGGRRPRARSPRGRPARLLRRAVPCRAAHAGGGQCARRRRARPAAQAILASLAEERGELSLEHLRALPGEEIKAALARYKGVGPKSIACVLLFCLGRAECPVDTHVWHIAKQLGWVGDGASREATYEHLNAVVPDEHK